MWIANSQQQDGIKSACETSCNKLDNTNESRKEEVQQHTSISNGQQQQYSPHAPAVALTTLQLQPWDQQQQQQPSQAPLSSQPQADSQSQAQLTLKKSLEGTAEAVTMPPESCIDGSDNSTAIDLTTTPEGNPPEKKDSWAVAYKARVEAEIIAELAHPDEVYITEAQYKLDRECAEFAVRAHREGRTVDLQVAKTIFYLSSFHFKEENHSMELYTDPSSGARRQEWVDFVRRQNDGYVLYLWDQRIAIMLTLKNYETNTFQPRFFLAMTNLYMQLGGGNVHKELVLLDILVRMDVLTYVDALVGVIATGEVMLWKHSKDHLRFLHCDFMNEIERGENFWIAKRQQFYEERGLLYLPQRMIPRDLDAPRTRFAISKEYITNYKHAYTSESDVKKNFDKWTLAPGRFKSMRELADTASASGKRHSNSNAAGERERNDEKARQDAIQKRNDDINQKRQATRKKNQEDKKKEEQRILLNKHLGEKRSTVPLLPPPPLRHPPAPPPAPSKPNKSQQPTISRLDNLSRSSSSSMTEALKPKHAGQARYRNQGITQLIYYACKNT